LSKTSILNEFITDKIRSQNFWGINLTILSPDENKLNKLISKWKTEEVKIVKREMSGKKSSKENDYKKKIADFDLDVFNEDTSEENGSCIALMVCHKEANLLLLSDSHPSVVTASLKKMGYGGTKRLAIDYMQIAHHGSKFNTNDDLLQCIDCRNYIISADGLNTNNLPNKETIARIIRRNPNRNLNFFITQKNNFTSSIFKVDEYNNRVHMSFPPANSNGLILDL
jgi:beta-lactamase superfamily II metal-dependent hydrolase